MLLFLFDLFVPIKTFYDQEARLTVMSACMDRIEALFAEKQLDDSGTQLLTDSNAPEIEYRNVTFAYDQKDVLKDVSFKADKGTMTALVGPSGGGKTTVAALVSRFFDATSGAVRIGGVDVKDIPPETLSDKIAYVFQDSRLLKRSILENVRLGKPEASREAALDALHRAQCDDILAKLPDGADTVIGAKGTYLSGGERQRIAIARMILKDAPIVVLDEATAFADPENEALVQKSFEELAKGKTVLMIAHRLTTVRNADNILVLKDGKPEESGSHEQLMRKHGLYEAMWNEYRSAAQWKVGVRREKAERARHEDIRVVRRGRGGLFQSYAGLRPVGRCSDVSCRHFVPAFVGLPVRDDTRKPFPTVLRGHCRLSAPDFPFGVLAVQRHFLFHLQRIRRPADCAFGKTA